MSTVTAQEYTDLLIQATSGPIRRLPSFREAPRRASGKVQNASRDPPCLQEEPKLCEPRLGSRGVVYPPRRPEPLRNRGSAGPDCVEQVAAIDVLTLASAEQRVSWCSQQKRTGATRMF